MDSIREERSGEGARVGRAGRMPESIERVLVVGANRSGRAAAALLTARGRRVVLSDTKPPAELLDLAGLSAAGVRVLTGEQGVDQLAGIDLVVKSPGVPGEVPVIRGARLLGIPVWSEVELAYRVLDNPFTAVTGTNGKTTTTALIGHMFSTAGIPVRVLGNIGTAITSVAGEVSTGDELVVELSSFQLEDVDAFRPESGVLLNVTEDHLDRHGTMEGYMACKAKLFARQGPDDWAVLNHDDRRVRELGSELELRDGGPRVAYFATSGPQGPVVSWLESGRLTLLGAPSVSVSELSLRGLHNVENCLGAATAALLRGVPVEAVAQALRTFPGVPHRLQRAGEIGGVAYVNDSKATNVEAALKALDAYPRGTHLIAGGRDKASDYRPLARACVGSCVAVYVIGEAAPLIAEAFARVREEEGPAGLPEPRDAGDLERAVQQARVAARPGETVLLAPACASFDQYRDFEERGEHFMALVEQIRAESE